MSWPTKLPTISTRNIAREPVMCSHTTSKLYRLADPPKCSCWGVEIFKTPTQSHTLSAANCSSKLKDSTLNLKQIWSTLATVTMLAPSVTSSSWLLEEELEQAPLVKYTVSMLISGQICPSSIRSAITIALVRSKANRFSCFAEFTTIHDSTLTLLSAWMWVCKIRISRVAGRSSTWTLDPFRASLRQDRVSALARLTKTVF